MGSIARVTTTPSPPLSDLFLCCSPPTCLLCAWVHCSPFNSVFATSIRERKGQTRLGTMLLKRGAAAGPLLSHPRGVHVVAFKRPGGARQHVVERGRRGGSPREKSGAHCRSTVVCEAATKTATVPDSADVVVIGSGIGGLCCAAIAARYGFSVTVLESHSIAGGCAHSFHKSGYEFDSGPSFFAGIEPESKSNNALKQILDLVGEKVECVQYGGWTAYLPEIRKFGGEEAVSQFKSLSKVMEPLAKSTEALSFANLRNDIFAAFTAGRDGPAFVKSGVFNGGPFDAIQMLNGPFQYMLDKAEVNNTFLRNLIDLECFVLSGVPASGTLSPEMAYMYQERHKDGSTLDYPVGGCKGIIDALVRGIEKYGGRVVLGKHVEEITFENGKATGVLLSNGKRIKANKKVVSNASIWDTYSKLVPKSELPPQALEMVSNTPPLDSFVHLHLGMDGKGLSEDIGIHHLVVNSWEGGVDTEQNVVNISIPPMIDKSVAPEGKHLVHAYTAANEPYSLWKNLKRGSKEYNQMKEERSECIWKALEKVIPDIKARSEVTLVGTPLTHKRFNRRHQGSYGPGVIAGKQSWPTSTSAVDGLLLCGDSIFPGIGVPAVAASGFIAANTIASMNQHLALLDELEAM